MDKIKSLDRMKFLIKELNTATEAYDKGHPYISDKEWDDMYFELAELEKELKVYFSNSPTQEIIFTKVSALNKVEHNHKMLSADKTKDWNKFVEYFLNKDFVIMPKLDGLTLSLRYFQGNLVAAETRGNGLVGEDVLHNALVVENIPNKIDYQEELIIDGEIVCKKNDFEKINSNSEYSNPRNYAAGSIRLLDSRECKNRNLTFVVWNVIKGFDYTNDFTEKISKLSLLGFTTIPFVTSIKEKDNIIEEANKLSYPIDGLVGRFEDIAYGEHLGETEHHTKAIYAFKFYDEEYETTLKEIEWSLGRTGILTPIAIYEDIDIEGSICNRASLHNISVLYETLKNKPFIGQKIKVAKMNMIIPQIVDAEVGNNINNNLQFELPKICPVCGKATVEKNNLGVRTLWCSNPQCEGKLVNQIDHFVGKKGLDVNGLSKATIEKLIEWGWVKSIHDIFLLDSRAEEWKRKNGFGERSVENMLKSIRDSKNCSLESFISGLGIPLIGRTVARKICEVCPTWNDFREASDRSWSELDGFGFEIEKAIRNFNYTEADIIAEMLRFNTLVSQSLDDSKPKPAASLTFCITGKSRFGSRDKVKQLIEEAGGKVTSSVTSKTDYLLANKEENTSKYNNAIKYNTKIINDDELANLLKM